MNIAARSLSLRPFANELPAPSSQGGGRAGGSTGLAVADELARAERLLVVSVVVEVAEAVATHLCRLARSEGRECVVVHMQGGDDAWREALARLGGADIVCPIDAAAYLAAADANVTVVLREPADTTWARGVTEELARRLAAEDAPLGPRFVLLTQDPTRRMGSAPVAVVTAQASARDLAVWWQAVAHEAHDAIGASFTSLDQAERWWSAASATEATPNASPSISLSPEGSRLLARVGLAGRALTSSETRALGDDRARAEILTARAAALDSAGALFLPSCSAVPAGDADDARAVAELLGASRDPWALMRASELHLSAGQIAAAEAALARALTCVREPAARADFWHRAEALFATEGARAPRLARHAELALGLGDVDEAIELSRRLVALDGDSFEAMLMLGRATTARGDLTTAEFALGRALASAQGAEERGRVSAELAEARYLAGDFDSAGRRAHDALEQGRSLETRLLARNVLGKLLLAEGAWSDADAHFAADACEASCSGHLVGELRARVNRAIAFLSSGRRDEAHAMLLGVLHDGERHGEARATVFALANLAAMATLRHDYAEALCLSERAIDERRRIGERIGLARLITNLAVLRLRVGLIDQAEQALAFGRKVCAPTMPGARLPHFALVSARIHLARGRTAEAARDVSEAIASAGKSSDGGKLGEGLRFAVRIALEDGDVPRARHLYERSEPHASTPDDRAEGALLGAQIARAAGEDFATLAEAALRLAQQCGDAELTREAHLLSYQALSIAGEDALAARHLGWAVALRDRVAGALPPGLRQAFLARGDLVELGALMTAGSANAPASDIPPPRASETQRIPAVPRAKSHGIVGQDRAMVALEQAIAKVGPSDATVLIHGESGTGKELIAEALHAASGRRSGPMVKVNCGALVETLLLSELFGHEKGAFTGASVRRRGRFELADGGTLFLDEIGDISPATQVALLRVLQDKTFERVGGASPLTADVRIVCATHRDLAELVAQGLFREDLYYRLRGVVLRVPALRERAGDLPALVTALGRRIAAERGEPTKPVSAEALAALARHSWPGNVRELDNALRVATLFAEGEVVELEDFVGHVPGLARGAAPTAPGSAPRLESSAGTEDEPAQLAYAAVRAGVSLSEMKRRVEYTCIMQALAESQGNITHAATLLGMKRPRLSQLVKQYGLGSVAEDV